MHFERLDFDRQRQDILYARVGDEGVFSGARVDWKGLMKADKAWLFEQLEQILARWSGAAAGDALWRLRGSLDEAGQLSYRLDFSDTASATGWRSCAAWSALHPEDRSVILDTFGEILEAINALLLIYGDDEG